MASWTAATRSWLREAPYALGLAIFSGQVALGIVLFAIFQEFVPNELGGSDALGGYLLALYGGSRFLSETPTGAISDRIERKHGLLVGFAVMIPALALMGTIQNEYAYLGFAAILGVSTAFVWPATYAITADLYPPTQRGKIVGFLNVGQLLGFGLGALIGASLVETVADSLFVIAIAAVLIALTIAQVGVPAYRRSGLGPALDAVRPPLRSVLSVRLLFLSVLILAAMIGVSSLIPAIRPYGEDELGISFARLALLLMPAVVSGGLLYVPAGHLSDLIGRTRPLLIGQLLIIVGALTVAQTTFIPLAAFGTAVVFCGNVLSVPALSASMMDLAPESHRGTLIGWSVALSGLGLAAGPGLGGFLVNAFDSPTVFRVAALIACGAMLLTLAYGRAYGNAPAAAVPSGTPSG